MNDYYRFIIPIKEEAVKFLKEHFNEEHQSTDGSPFLNKRFYEGYLLSYEQYNDIPSYITEYVLIYKINDRFIDKEDFISSYWDGDVEDDDFIECL